MVKRREANFELTDENIAHQYENVFDGLQKDTAQNAWDARVTRKGKDWKLLFKYEPQSNILIIEDFCTTGMDEGGWSNYQNLWYTDKRDTLAGGSRGQGKFIFHYFSKDKTLLTETI